MKKCGLGGEENGVKMALVRRYLTQFGRVNWRPLESEVDEAQVIFHAVPTSDSHN